MPEPRSTTADGRTTMTRASDARPPKFYDPSRGRAEPPAVIAARERHRALNDEIERRREQLAAGQDPAPEEGGGDGRG